MRTNKRHVVIAMLTVCLSTLFGCSRPTEMAEVRCVAVHIYGESAAKGTLSERFTYMTAERTDTKERRNFVQVLGQPGETFKMEWNQPYYQ